MRHTTLLVWCIALVALAPQAAEASFDRFLFRRQAEAAQGEQESTTTPKSTAQQESPPQQVGGGTGSTSTSNNNNNNNGRLYPDLAHRPNFIPPFNAPPHHAQPPFVPYGLQVPGDGRLPQRLNADQQAAPFGRMPVQPRPVTAAERLQSQTFSDGLGKRLLSMIGIDMGNATAAPESAGAGAASSSGGQMVDQATMRALQNATVLERLSQRLNAVMGGLGKMYNSTAQDQLSLLSERYKKAAENATDPWQRGMAERVPMFFKQMAARVGQAQEQLNRVWLDVTRAVQGNSSVLNRQQAAGQQPHQAGFFSSISRFMGPDRMNFFAGGTGGGVGPADPMTRSLGERSDEPQATGQAQQHANMATRLREFWHAEVQPQVSMLSGQVARAWRDLTASGALPPESLMRPRSNQNNLAAARNKNGSSSSSSSSDDLVDSILKEIDMDSNNEYALVDSKGEAAASGAETSSSSTTMPGVTASGNADEKPKPVAKLSPQMQNRLLEMQQQVNQLWMGLTRAMQSTMTNMRNSMGRSREQLEPAASERGQADPKENEIDDKISELSKLQRDADAVQQVVKQQQQRQSFADRFRGFINHVDMSGINQLPDRIGQQFNRFGNAVGTFWNQIPERWDSFMTSARQPSRDAMMQ